MKPEQNSRSDAHEQLTRPSSAPGPPRSWLRTCPATLLRLFLLACFCLPGHAAETGKLELGPSRVHLTAGNSLRLELSHETAALISDEVAVESETIPSTAYPISAGLRPREKALFLATPPNMPAGAYGVKLSLTSKMGETYRGSVAVVVEPLPPIAQTGRPAVLLVNGFSLSSITTGACILSEDSTGTFGRLEELLVADGAPVVFFDNCRFGSPAIEVLGRELGTTIGALQHEDGSSVSQVDIVAFSMGSLIARSYLAGKQLAPGLFLPPADPKVRKLVLVAGEHFGTPLAALDAGEQLPALRPGSQFLWDLATWHQGFDDLREVDAIALAGTGSTNEQGDGVAPLASASLASASFFGQHPDRTRILPVCHNRSARLLCSTAEVIMEIDSENHPSGRIIRSFLAGTEEWRSIGENPSENSTLGTNGGIFFGAKNVSDEFLPDITEVVATDPRDIASNPDITLDRGPTNIFFKGLMPSLDYLFDVRRPDGDLAFSASVPAQGSVVVLAKLGPVIFRVQPAAGGVDTLSVAADSLISIFGRDLATASDFARSLPLPTDLAGTTVTANGELLGLLYAGPGQVNACLPSGMEGLVQIKARNPLGEHAVNVLIAPAVPALFAADGSGQGQAAALDASTNEILTLDNPTSPGALVALFATGLGETTTSKKLQAAQITPQVFADGIPAEVLFAGAAPNFAGLNQVNVRIPEGVTPGPAVPVLVRSGKYTSNQVTLAIE